MAEPVDFNPPLRNPREALCRQLAEAPEAHVEALLDGYEILQLLHDKGILEIVKGALGSGEKLLQITTETMEQDDVVRTVRNLTILLKIVGSLDPDRLDTILSAMSNNVVEVERKKPPGLLRLLARLASRPSRRALAPLATAVQTVGQNLNGASPRARARIPRKKTMRHRA